MKKTVWIIIGLALAVVMGIAYFLFGRGFGGVTLTAKAESEARIGEPFNIVVTLENKSDEDISNTTISLSLPTGVSFADGGKDLRRTVKLKKIPAGAFERETFSVVITEFSEDKSFEAEAEYLPSSLGRTIRTSKDLSIKVERWLTLNVEAPEKIVSGEEFEWIFTYENNTDKEWNVDLDFEIPEELETDLPDKKIKIAANERKSETFNGTAVMEEGKSFTIKATAKGDIQKEEYIFGDAAAEVLMAPSPLSLNVSSTKGIDEPVHPGEEITYAISFRNNSDTIMRNVSVKAALIGEMFDITSINSRGEVNTTARTIIWNIGLIPELAEIKIGESRSLSFSIKINDAYPVRRLNDRNFTVGINAQIESSTVPYALKALKTVNVASITQKVAGKIEASAKALYRDAASGVINEGIFPPAAGQPTEYSIHWDVMNYSTDMSEVEISAETPPGVEFVRQVKIDAGEFTADQTNGRIVWKIPKVLATTGVLSDSLTAIFQIRATPNASQVGQYMPILGPTSITATDDFTGTVFSTFQEFITTELPSDGTVKQGEGTVK
ncbi:MAG: hypothetical protein WC519_03125 [Parcubacteria group bacterium]